jgi:uncharacterized membrane protein
MSDPTVPPPPPYYSPPPAPGGPTSGAASPNRSIMIVLSYLWLLCLIPLLMEKGDSEVQWHARNGLVLLIAEVIVAFAFFAVNMVLMVLHVGFLGCFLSLLHLLIFFGFLVIHIVCIVKGLKGERFMVPLISQYADSIKF